MHGICRENTQHHISSSFNAFIQLTLYLYASYVLFAQIMEVHASQWRKGPSVHPIVESQPDASKNMVEYCKTTLVYKPLRSKYCVQMGFVVARFDHYCFWLHTTVGYENHRQFIGLLLSLTVLLICLMVAMIR